jgi:hypothetical protein
MDAPTAELHETILRLAKGILSAYERWIRVKKEMKQVA